MQRKLESGCELQDVACARSGAMIYLELVDSKIEQRARTYGSSDLLEGTKVALRLTQQWHRSGRVVVADSHFASLELAEELYRRDIRFLGVIKNNTTGFPKE